MPPLSEYLGHLLSEITRARVQADLESVRMAELYAEHPLLKHFSIPRFRMPTITVDVPVVIRGIEGEGTEPDTKELRKTFESTLDARLKEHAIKLESDVSRRLRNEVNAVIESSQQPRGSTISLTRLADDLVDRVVPLIHGAGEAKTTFQELADDLRKAARIQLANLRGPGPRVDVGVTAGELHDAGAAGAVARFQLSVSEEGVAWSVVDAGDKAESRLVPE